MAGAPEEFIAAYNDRDWERMRGLLAPDCFYEQVGRPKRVAEGPEAFIEVFQGWAGAGPETEGRIAGRIDGGDRVVLEIDLLASRQEQAPFGEYPASAKPPATRAALVFGLDTEGRVRELRNYYDSLVLYQLLGIQA